MKTTWIKSSLISILQREVIMCFRWMLWSFICSWRPWWPTVRQPYWTSSTSASRSSSDVHLLSVKLTHFTDTVCLGPQLEAIDIVAIGNGPLCRVPVCWPFLPGSLPSASLQTELMISSQKKKSEFSEHWPFVTAAFCAVGTQHQHQRKPLRDLTPTPTPIMEVVEL